MPADSLWCTFYPKTWNHLPTVKHICGKTCLHEGGGCVFVSVRWCCVSRMQECEVEREVLWEAVFRAQSQWYEKAAPHLCPTSIPLPRLFCPEGNLFPPISISHAIQARVASVVCRVHAIPVCHTSGGGKLLGFVTGVWEPGWALQITIGAY